MYDHLPWKLIQQWEANGEFRNISKYNISATHKPKTIFGNEKLIIFKDNVKIVREKINTKWSDPYVC